MKIVQINAVYEKYSTGRTTKELHESLLSLGYESYIASPALNGLNDQCFKIGNKLDRKVHALLSRILGLQGYFSTCATSKLISFLEDIHPDVIILRNLHGNYINVMQLLDYISNKQIATVLVLHDCWFYTGKCVYYIEDNCYKWKEQCGNCPALKKGNTSLFFDRSSKMLTDKANVFKKMQNKLAVIGVSKWVIDDVNKSILKNAQIKKYIYNWIDLKLFKPDLKTSVFTEFNLPSKKIILGVAMNWNKPKGIDVFNGLADILNDDYQIVLIGDLSVSVHEKIISVGTIKDPKKLADFFVASYVFLNPSIQETFGKTTAEAMACGTPIIAYNGTAMPELIGTDGKCGILVNSQNPQEYKKALEIIDNGNIDLYKIACRSRAEKLFDKEKNIEEYLNVFGELVNLGD